MLRQTLLRLWSLSLFIASLPLDDAWIVPRRQRRRAASSHSSSSSSHRVSVGVSVGERQFQRKQASFHPQSSPVVSLASSGSPSQHTDISGSSSSSSSSSRSSSSSSTNHNEKAPVAAATTSALGAWIPVGSASSLNGLTPTRVEIMGRAYVVWQQEQVQDQEDDGDNQEQWSVLEDVCPHRLVPLSQGRINPNTNCLECAYHGWQFDTNGAVTCIPQRLEPNSSNAKNKELLLPPLQEVTIPRAATSLPVHLTGDLIWAFFPTHIHGESFPIDLLPEDFYHGLKDDIQRQATYHVHEMPCSFHMLVENGLDPSHFPFAHHGVISKRSDAAPMPIMDVTTNNFTHLDVFTEYTREGVSRQRLYSFQRPSLLYTQEPSTATVTTTVDNEDTNDNNSSCSMSNTTTSATQNITTTTITTTWSLSSKFFIVPIREGESRIITSVEKLAKSWLPDWITHWATGRLFVGDYILHQAEYELTLLRQQQQQQQESSTGNTKYRSPSSYYAQPTTADNGVRGWNRWWKQHAMAHSPPHTFGPASPKHLLSQPPRSPRELYNSPWKRHTSTCSKCRKVLRRAKRLQFWSLLVGVVAGGGGGTCCALLLHQVSQNKKKVLFSLLASSCLGGFGLIGHVLAKRVVSALEGSPHESDAPHRSHSMTI